MAGLSLERIAPASPTRHESVVEELRRSIVTGEIGPGERLLQVELAERFGVSRIPLREAMRTLHAEGLIVIEPNRGAICRPLEPKDVSDLYAVRLALEQVAVREAAARAAGNAHVAHSLEGCWSQILRAMHYFFRHDAYPRDVWQQHTAIARSIAHGDGTGAAALLEGHIVDSRNAILRGLEEADR